MITTNAALSLRSSAPVPLAFVSLVDVLEEAALRDVTAVGSA